MADQNRTDQNHTDQNHTDQNHIVAELVEGSRICMVTTIDAEGRLTARPLTRQDGAFHGTVDFVVPRDGDFVAQIHARPEVNVTVQSTSGYVSLAGTAAEVTDRSTLEREWNAATAAFFPDGQETATVVRVDATTAEYWDSRGSSVAKIASFVRAAVTDGGRTPDLGDSGTVHL